MIMSNNRSYDPPRLLALQSTKNGKGEKKRLLINSIKLRIPGEIFVHATLKGINSVAIHNVWAESIPCTDDSVEKDVLRFLRVDMLADYLVSVSSSVVRQVYYEVLIAIHVVNVFHYFENLAKSPLNFHAFIVGIFSWRATASQQFLLSGFAGQMDFWLVIARQEKSTP